MGNYRAVVCRRCHRIYHVHPWAEKFTYWFCWRNKDGKHCGTFNIWKGTTTKVEPEWKAILRKDAPHLVKEVEQAPPIELNPRWQSGG